MNTPDSVAVIVAEMRDSFREFRAEDKSQLAEWADRLSAVAARGEAVAWMADDGRVIPAESKAAGERCGGATKSATDAYPTPLYTALTPSATAAEGATPDRPKAPEREWDEPCPDCGQIGDCRCDWTATPPQAGQAEHPSLLLQDLRMTLSGAVSSIDEALASQAAVTPAQAVEAVAEVFAAPQGIGMGVFVLWLKDAEDYIGAKLYTTPQPAQPSEQDAVLTVENAPLGTVGYAVGGGHWCRVQAGWKWNGPDGSGSTFPRLGGDWDGRLVAPPLAGQRGDAVAEVVRGGDGRNVLAWRREWLLLDTPLPVGTKLFTRPASEGAVTDELLEGIRQAAESLTPGSLTPDEQRQLAESLAVYLTSQQAGGSDGR